MSKEKEYQELFNKTLSKIRLACNAAGNKPLGNIIIKIMFDFSDELKRQLIEEARRGKNGKGNLPTM